jgi:hypothetical protein
MHLGFEPESVDGVDVEQLVPAPTKQDLPLGVVRG